MQHGGLCNRVNLVVEDDRERLGFGKEVKNSCERGKRVLGLEGKKSLGFGRKKSLVAEERVSSESNKNVVFVLFEERDDFGK